MSADKIIQPDRQPCHLVVGAGRVGASIAAYLTSLGADVAIIRRSDLEQPGDKPLASALAKASIIALAVPDGAIAEVLTSLRPLASSQVEFIHFSGAMVVEGAWSVHPLYSFPPEPLARSVMETIPFAVEAAGPAFGQLFPGAPNPVLVIPNEKRALYHSLAVLSGNFSAFLWNECARVFADEIDDGAGPLLASYLAGVVERFRESPFQSMTGPLARRDAASVARNLESLAGHEALARLYGHFLAEAWPDAPGDLKAQAARAGPAAGSQIGAAEKARNSPKKSPRKTHGKSPQKSPQKGAKKGP